jgi:hypothetical protein
MTMSERGALAKEARRIASEHGVSLRQAYRYAAAGRMPADCVRVGVDGRRYHVRLTARYADPVRARRISYMIAAIGKKAAEHGIVESDLGELELAARRLEELVAVWRSWLSER